MIHDPLERWARALMTPDAPELDHECTDLGCTNVAHLPDPADTVWGVEAELTEEDWL